MSIELARAARLELVADVPVHPEAARKLREDFTVSMRSLSYREMSALARAYNINKVTVWRWRYNMALPKGDDREIMFAVIQWVQLGKPTHWRPMSSGLADLLN